MPDIRWLLAKITSRAEVAIVASEYTWIQMFKSHHRATGLR
ncbi:hypothetical protein [Nostoc sp. KVJ20]|nr:hypothetical protein [Nostoc sp. KVJ20]